MLNSKFEVRMEAVRLATMVEGINTSEVIPLSRQIAAYIMGGITDLPETYDQQAQYKEMLNAYTKKNIANYEAEKA